MATYAKPKLTAQKVHAHTSDLFFLTTFQASLFTVVVDTKKKQQLNVPAVFGHSDWVGLLGGLHSPRIESALWT